MAALLAYAGEEDAAAVVGDVATLEWVRDRFAHTLKRSDVSRIDNLLGELRAAADAGGPRLSDKRR